MRGNRSSRSEQLFADHFGDAIAFGQCSVNADYPKSVLLCAQPQILSHPSAVSGSIRTR
jgi:hypothetical protein